MDAVPILARVFEHDLEAQMTFRIKLAPAILKVSRYRTKGPMSEYEVKSHLEFFEALAVWVKEDVGKRMHQLSKISAQDAVDIEELFNGGQAGVDYFVVGIVPLETWDERWDE